MKTQFITNAQGKKTAVVLPLKEYEKMMAALEDLEDIRLYDEAKKDKSNAIPIKDAFKQLDAIRKKG